jgi:hypothetical protein
LPVSLYYCPNNHSLNVDAFIEFMGDSNRLVNFGNDLLLCY